jgi:peptide/nickel transport system permease protein
VRALALRVAESLLVVFVVASLTFFALRLLPGDPALLILGDQASPEALATVREKLHLGEPMILQYARFCARLLTFDFGESLRWPGTDARTRVLSALGPTSQLAVTSTALGALFGTSMAVLASGPWLGRASRLLAGALTALAAVPLLALAPLLTWLFAVRLRACALPGDVDAGPGALLFGAALLAIPLGAHVGRVAHASLGDVSRALFLTTARAKGARPARVWFVHALATVMGPVVTTIAAQLGALLGGAVVVERLFQRHGLGSLMLDAYASRDLPVLEGAIVAAGALFVVAQAVATGAHLLVDPRARERAR